MKKLLDGAFGLLLNVVLVGVLLVAGAGMVATGLGERKLGEAPLVPVAELARHDGETVRVRARVSGEPALQAAGRERLALQAVTISHTESSGSGADRTERTVTDYARLAPEMVLATDGSATVGVLTEGVELRFVPERFRGTTGSEGALPGEAAALVASSFAGFPERSQADLSVRAIPDGAEVTIHGTVEVVDGQALLRSPETLPFVITPLPFEEVLREAGSSGTWNLVLGSGLLLGALALVWMMVRDRFRRPAAEPAAA